MENQTAVITKNDISQETEFEIEKGGVDAPKTVCFVCTGNTCRSPMAAAVLNQLGKGKYRAFSAGLSVFAGPAEKGSTEPFPRDSLCLRETLYRQIPLKRLKRRE